MDYAVKLGQLEARRNDPNQHTRMLNEVYKSMHESPAIKYAIGAMQPIDDEYTKNTFVESERVQNHLVDPLKAQNIDVEFDYQGSVTTNTHIRVHSDLDTLVVHKRFFGVQPPKKPDHPYTGNPLQDLIELRTHSTAVVQGRFPQVSVDTTKARCISLSGGSLRRKLDFIFGNRWDTIEYQASGVAHDRGIEVLDIKENRRVANKPFLHNKRLNDKDAATLGNLKKLIRLVKSLQYDEDEKNGLSSYDIAAVLYHIPIENMYLNKGQELLLIRRCLGFLYELVKDQARRESLYVPNELRRIFCAEGANFDQLLVTMQLVATLEAEIDQGLQRSFRKLADARIAY